MIFKFCTHVPLLYYALHHTTGPVVELGMGLCSTPLLNALCFGEREVYSFDHDPNWVQTMESHCRSDYHAFRHAGDWDVAYEIVRKINPSVILVDHGGVQDHVAAYDERAHAVEILRDLDAVFVVHDVDAPALAKHELHKGFHFAVVDLQKPRTAVYCQKPLMWPHLEPALASLTYPASILDNDNAECLRFRDSA